ncbi:MAG: Glutaredoxin-like domain [Chloroflexota bacterium]|jgi:glutaredoxin|nr:Glutaredoxin-like domain [Chloroflexota bacterium]
MSDPLPRPVLTVYRREGCHLCEEARSLLQAALEDRARRGEPTPRVREVDIDSDTDLHDRYYARIPVFSLDGAELDLVTSDRQVRTFLDRTLPGLA